MAAILAGKLPPSRDVLDNAGYRDALVWALRGPGGGTRVRLEGWGPRTACGGGSTGAPTRKSRPPQLWGGGASALTMGGISPRSGRNGRRIPEYRAPQHRRLPDRPPGRYRHAWDRTRGCPTADLDGSRPASEVVPERDTDRWGRQGARASCSEEDWRTACRESSSPTRSRMSKGG